MSDRQRAEMAEAKLAAIKSLLVDDPENRGWYTTERMVIDIIDAQEFGGYWQGNVQVALAPPSMPEGPNAYIDTDTGQMYAITPLDHKET